MGDLLGPPMPRFGGGAMDDIMRPGGSSRGPNTPGPDGMDKVWGNGGNGDQDIMRQVIRRMQQRPQQPAPQQPGPPTPEGQPIPVPRQPQPGPMRPQGGGGIESVIARLMGGGGRMGMGGMLPGGGQPAPAVRPPSGATVGMSAAAMPAVADARKAAPVAPSNPMPITDPNGGGGMSTQGWFEDFLKGGNKMPPGMEGFLKKLMKSSGQVLDLKAPNYKGDRVANETAQLDRARQAMNKAGNRIMDPEQQYTRATDQFLKPDKFTNPAMRNRFDAPAEIAAPVINARPPDQREY